MNENKIIEMHGDNPISLLLLNNEVFYVLEEKKINKHLDYNKPILASRILKEMFNLNDCDISFNEFPGLTPKSEFLGLEYNANFTFQLILRNSLYYELFKIPHATPQQLFDRVCELLHQGKKIGWFQNRWRSSKGIDPNRCIITKSDRINNIDKYDVLKYNTHLNRIISTLGPYSLDIVNLDRYSPQDAIELLKDKQIDVLVLNNCICALEILED